MTIRRPLVPAGILALIAACDAAGADRGLACAARMHVAPGILAAKQLQCHAKVAGTAKPVSVACLARATSRFLARASLARCVMGDQVAALRAAAEVFVADAADALASHATAATRPCVTKKVVATGKVAREKLTCHARGVRKGTAVDPACLAGASDELAARWASAEAHAPCATTGDLPALGSRVDDFVNEVIRLLAPDPALFRGTYDVSFEFSDPYLGPNDDDAPLGVAQPGADGELSLDIFFDLFDGLFLSGRLTAGEFSLDGYFIDGGDIYYDARGRATASGTGESRIAGSADILGFNGEVRGTVTFTLSRPAGGTPGSLGGTYQFSFPNSPSDCGCSSTASFDLTVPPDGFGGSGAATDTRADSAAVGFFAAGTCLVSPGGSVRCTTSYDPVDESGPTAMCAQQSGTCPFIFHGGLPVAARPTGDGEYMVGLPPPYKTGFWTSAR